MLKFSGRWRRSCCGVATLLVASLASLASGADNIRAIPAENAPNAYPYSVNGFHVVDFKTENLVAPEGIDTPNPRFSWKLASQTLNEKQSAYQITVRNTNAEEVVWDTGKIESDEQLYIPYAGDPLQPGAEYMVELNVWNKDGSQKSQIYAPFSMGLFPTADDPNPWKGKWIGVSSKIKQPDPADISSANWIAFEDKTSLPIGASVYRKTFTVDNVDDVVAAIANFSADNRGAIYVNGVSVGGSDEYRRAATRDIKANLRTGKNVIAVRADNVGGDPNPGGIVGAFYVETKDGKTTYVTDESWKSHEGFEESYVALDCDDSNWGQSYCIAKCGDAPWNEIVAAPLEIPSPARYLSKVYMMQDGKEVKRAVVYISGLGYNECYLNGVKLGDQVCGPMYTDYNVSVPYNTYDATDVFQMTKELGAKDVEIGVVLGNGRFYAVRIDKCVHYGEPRLLFQMQVEYTDGTKDVVVSDESWRGTANGPISENNDYDGEVADGRLAKLIAPDSSDAQYQSGAPSRYLETRFGKAFVVETPDQVDVVDAPKGKLVAQNIPPMRENMEIKPISIKEMAPGRYIYDFGQNFVGVPRIKVKGEAGQKVQIRFAETLKEDGELYLDNLRTAQARDIYTLYGDPDGEIYEPRFTQHGGRYAEMIGYPGVPDLDSVTGYTVTTDVPLVGSFETSNATINQIFKNIEWGTRGNYLSMPTDCPQRDERMGWQGDRAAGSKGEMYIFDNASLYNKWMQDIEETQREDGNVSDVAPAYWQLYSPNVTWPSAQFIIPQSLQVMFGDDSAIIKHFDSRKKWLNFILSLANDKGLIERDNYGDWCVPPERPELIHSQDPMRQTNRTLISSSYMINNLRISADFADQLGKTEDAKSFRATADKMQDAFNKEFFNTEKAIYDNGSQTSSVLPLEFNIVPESERERVFTTLAESIEQKTNKHLGVGLIGAQWVNRLLSDNGRIDLPYAFATHRDFPSWGYMIEKGATTIWELWNGDTADPAMNSGNHVMLVGDLNIWFFEYLAGIKGDPKTPGFKHIIMRPNVVGDLTSAKGVYDSVRGFIVSDWKLEDGKFVWKIVIPANTTATVSVPTSDPSSLAMRTTRLDLVPPEPGEIRFAKYTRNFADFDVSSLDKKTCDWRVEFELGCGAYEITAEFK